MPVGRSEFQEGVLRLYHSGPAICAQKVRMCLAEKQLTWESHIVQDGPEGLRSPAYLALNPNGYVPTLLHGDRVVTESRLINEYLDLAFSAGSLHPADPFGKYRVARWTKQIDDSLHLNIYVLSFVILFRETRLALDEQALARSLPLTNPVKRAYTLQMLEHGFTAPPVRAAVERFVALLTEMEAALTQHEWLAGEQYSLADVDFTPYVARLDGLGVWPLLAHRYPNVGRWLAMVRARASFAEALLSWSDDAEVIRTRHKAEAARPQLAAILEAALGPHANPDR